MSTTSIQMLVSKFLFSLKGAREVIDSSSEAVKMQEKLETFSCAKKLESDQRQIGYVKRTQVLTQRVSNWPNLGQFEH